MPGLTVEAASSSDLQGDVVADGLRPAPASSVLRDQNTPEAIGRLRAMMVSHARAQRLSGSLTMISLLLAGGGLAATFMPTLAGCVTVLGAVWALAYGIGLASWEGGEGRRAALLQELLDVRLFQLGWNDVLAGEEPLPHEVSGLSRRFRGSEDSLRDYYEIPDLPHPYDVLACQQQNLGWGARVRRRYGRAVMTAVLVWIGAGLVVGFVRNLSVSDLLLRWYVPSYAALLMGVDIFRSQQEVSTERERVLSLVRARILVGAPSGELTRLARQVQDVIFQSRQRHTRVPNWFFRRYQAVDRADFRAAMAELEDVVARLAGQRDSP